jgi:CubicO group peptidase (beta-lactamase class C family)
MRALKSIVLAILMVLTTVPARAAELPTASPESVGLSSAKLNEARQAVQSLVDQKEIAGAVLVVARRGKVVQLDAVGVMDVGSGKPMKPDTIFRIFSMTKPVTTVAAMILVDEGKIQLDDPVAKYLPEFKDLRVHTGKGDETVDVKRPMTVRDLMRHTSGLTYAFAGSTPVEQLYQKSKVLDPGDSLQELVAKLGKIPLLHQPGTRFQYSVSTDVLGRVVEVASGKSLDAFFEERIFKPLDMKDTGFWVPEAKLARFPAVHGGSKGELKVTETAADSRYRKKPVFLSGGGGLVSTARDYLRFCQMLLNGGELDGARLLRKETVQSMIQNQLPDEAMPVSIGPLKLPGTGFGLGFGVVVTADKTKPVGAIGEYFWGGAASTHFWISPSHELAVVVMEQYMPFNQRLQAAVKPIVYQAVAEK